MTCACLKSSHELSLTMNYWTLYNCKTKQRPVANSNSSLPLVVQHDYQGTQGV